MPLTWDEIQANAITFSKRWKGFKGIEKQHDQQFITELLACFGVNSSEVGIFQEKAGTKWIDYLWPSMLGIEMKSPSENLSNAKTQLFNYLPKLQAEAVPQYLIVSDFVNIHLYRLSTNDIHMFKTADLRKHIKKFADIAGYTTERVHDDQVEVNVKAAEKMAKLHDALKTHGYEGHELEVYLVRLLFCLFADDTGIFPQDSFSVYVEASKPDGSDLSHRISDLFEVLNMPEEVRAKKTLLSEELRRFRYVNGGLFAERLAPADFDAKMRQALLDCANFDWNAISPAIFGAMFQGVMDKGQRREMGAHYTSEENILKLINPLFLDELWAEFDRVKTDPIALERFHDKLADLRFLDPACGCGNFLIITYRELRKLELEALKMQFSSNQMILDVSPLLKVNVAQFYGIEYEEFPCQIAQVGMWLIDHQMNLRVSEQFGQYYARLPLTQSAIIVHGNALRLDWEGIVPKRELSYILGNPPFVGHQWRNKEQQEDMGIVFAAEPTYGKLDYVCSWHYKAAQFIKGTRIQVAFVSTNSIVQGESVGAIWKPLFAMGIEITYAYYTFVWTNDAKGKAAVHCVIIGFANLGLRKTKQIFIDNHTISADNINGYLLNAPNVFIQSRSKPLFAKLPEMSKGSQPTDGGNLILTVSERNEMIKSYPQTEKWIRQYMGAEDYINSKVRYCLWLKGVAPAEYRSVSPIMERLSKVADMRRKSPTASVKRDAETPMLFTQIRQPERDYIIVPRVSSERRRYIPIGFMTPDAIATDAVLIIPGATVYHFGVLTSNVHMAWTRIVCGRLKSDYRYTPAIYNNFPWCEPTEAQRAAIEKTAQGILDARALFSNNSLADLYDPLTMPPELRKAHQANDRAVMKAYGFTAQNTPSEAACVARLMEMYRSLTNGEGK
ncbi:MAG: N-6 DNA methylase [Clostridiales bacterium]|jgi:hypothetical protein|nr:N-6 DNA methylase [Clostridiales bacterium]